MLNKDLSQKDSTSNSFEVQMPKNTHTNARTKAPHTCTHSYPDTNVSCNVFPNISLQIPALFNYTCPDTRPSTFHLSSSRSSLHFLSFSFLSVSFSFSLKWLIKDPQAISMDTFVPPCGHLIPVTRQHSTQFPTLALKLSAL